MQPLQGGALVLEDPGEPRVVRDRREPGLAEPRTRAVITVTGNERNLPTRAAASAGTMSKVIDRASIVELIEANRMPNAPTSIVETIQFTAASRSGL